MHWKLCYCTSWCNTKYQWCALCNTMYQWCATMVCRAPKGQLRGMQFITQGDLNVVDNLQTAHALCSVHPYTDSLCALTQTLCTPLHSLEMRQTQTTLLFNVHRKSMFWKLQLRKCNAGVVVCSGAGIDLLIERVFPANGQVTPPAPRNNQGKWGRNTAKFGQKIVVVVFIPSKKHCYITFLLAMT
jgi:hypothetical protein